MLPLFRAVVKFNNSFAIEVKQAPSLIVCKQRLLLDGKTLIWILTFSFNITLIYTKLYSAYMFILTFSIAFRFIVSS